MTGSPRLRVPVIPLRLRAELLPLGPLQVSDKQQRLADGRDPEFDRLAGGDRARIELPLTLYDVKRWYARRSRLSSGCSMCCGA